MNRMEVIQFRSTYFEQVRYSIMVSFICFLQLRQQFENILFNDLIFPVCCGMNSTRIYDVFTFKIPS
jgi:hypothetical protein